MPASSRAVYCTRSPSRKARLWIVDSSHDIHVYVFVFVLIIKKGLDDSISFSRNWHFVRVVLLVISFKDFISRGIPCEDSTNVGVQS
jgi:hypothetical protein